MCAKHPTSEADRQDLVKLAVHNMLTAARFGNIPDVTAAVCLWLSENPGSTLIDLERFLREEKFSLGLIADVKGVLLEKRPENYSYYSLLPPFQKVKYSIIFSMRPNAEVIEEREKEQGTTVEENEEALLQCGVAVMEGQVEKLDEGAQKVLLQSPEALGHVKLMVADQDELHLTFEAQQQAGMTYAKLIHDKYHPDAPEPEHKMVLIGMGPDGSAVFMPSADGQTPLLLPGPDNKPMPCTLGIMVGYGVSGKKEQLVVSLQDRNTWVGFMGPRSQGAAVGLDPDATPEEARAVAAAIAEDEAMSSDEEEEEEEEGEENTGVKQEEEMKKEEE